MSLDDTDFLSTDLEAWVRLRQISKTFVRCLLPPSCILISARSRSVASWGTIRVLSRETQKSYHAGVSLPHFQTELDVSGVPRAFWHDVGTFLQIDAEEVTIHQTAFSTDVSWLQVASRLARAETPCAHVGLVAQIERQGHHSLQMPPRHAGEFPMFLTSRENCTDCVAHDA